MNTVILLGAGASRSAGYPTANDLMHELEVYSNGTPEIGISNDWSTWTAFRDSQSSGSLVEILLQGSDPSISTNPEIVLSALDLFDAAQTDSLTRGTISAIKSDQNSQAEKIHNLYALVDNEAMKAARSARLALLKCLEGFLIEKSYDEFHHPEKCDYLREFFSDLRFGDTVITFNWDATAERTLGEMGLWNPTTGYGFDKSLTRHETETSDTVNKELLPSPVRVLKLHGSVGWKRQWLGDGQVYLDNWRLLKHLPVSLPSEANPVIFADSEFDPVGYDDSVIVAPTFLKAVPAGKDMQRVWFLAQKALAGATRIRVRGYSLPPSDAAARVLLNPLRFRLSEGDLEIDVTDPPAETRNRWDEFLGQRVSHDGRLG